MLLSRLVGWGVLVGLMGVMFVLLKTRGGVTGGVTLTLHLAQVQVFVYCLVLVSVVQVVCSQSLQEMHRTEPLYFFLLVMCWEKMGHM